MTNFAETSNLPQANIDALLQIEPQAVLNYARWRSQKMSADVFGVFSKFDFAAYREGVHSEPASR